MDNISHDHDADFPFITHFSFPIDWFLILAKPRAKPLQMHGHRRRNCIEEPEPLSWHEADEGVENNQIIRREGALEKSAVMGETGENTIRGGKRRENICLWCISVYILYLVYCILYTVCSVSMCTVPSARHTRSPWQTSHRTLCLNQQKIWDWAGRPAVLGLREWKYWHVRDLSSSAASTQGIPLVSAIFHAGLA